MRMLTEDERGWLRYLLAVEAGAPRKPIFHEQRGGQAVVKAVHGLVLQGRIERHLIGQNATGGNNYASYLTDAGRKAIRVDDIIRQLDM